MVMKLVKEDLSKILTRADVTESTQEKGKEKGVFLYCFRHLSKDFRHRVYTKNIERSKILQARKCIQIFRFH